jgi:hypothetical protein
MAGLFNGTCSAILQKELGHVSACEGATDAPNSVVAGVVFKQPRYSYKWCMQCASRIEYGGTSACGLPYFFIIAYNNNYYYY